MGTDWHVIPTDEAARQLGCSVDAVRRYWNSGILAGRKVGRSLQINQKAVLALQKVIAQAKSGVKPTPPPVASRRGPQDVEQAPIAESESALLDQPGGDLPHALPFDAESDSAGGESDTPAVA